jgi:hypothetical protein
MTAVQVLVSVDQAVLCDCLAGSWLDLGEHDRRMARRCGDDEANRCAEIEPFVGQSQIVLVGGGPVRWWAARGSNPAPWD